MDNLIYLLYIISLIWLIFEGKQYFFLVIIRKEFKSIADTFDKKHNNINLKYVKSIAHHERLYFEYVNNICNGNPYKVENKIQITQIVMLNFAIFGFLISWNIVLFSFILLATLLYVGNKEVDNYYKNLSFYK